MKCTLTYLRSIVLMIVCMTPLWAFSQNITVTGTVLDEAGDPLIGATVQQKGSGNGIATDIDGNFKLNVPKNATLVVSYVGYTTQAVAVDGRTSITITMKENSEVLDEVVVVGYGQMKRSDMTGSVASVSDAAIKKSVPTSIDQVLQGRAAGVQIQANSGTPGASSSIRIRGINSLNATNQPIFVIDGVVIDSATDDESANPLSAINPSDIVSMDILKDASATAIYGSRASARRQSPMTCISAGRKCPRNTRCSISASMPSTTTTVPTSLTSSTPRAHLYVPTCSAKAPTGRMSFSRRLS